MKAAVGAVLLTALFAVPAAADIRVWSERDRQGDGREIRRAVRDLRNYDFDDRISSLETDEAWEVCTEPLYRGDCRIVEGIVPNLRVLGLNNRITSMRKASEEMVAEQFAPAAPTKLPPRKPTPESSTKVDPARTAPLETNRVKAEPVPEPSPGTATAPPPSSRIKAESVPITPMKAEPVPEPSDRAKATAPPKSDPANAESVPERSASVAPATASPTEAKSVPSTPMTKPESVPQPSKSEPTKAAVAPPPPEPMPEPPARVQETASAKNEPAETEDTPADAWRSTKPRPAPAPEPTPVTGEWWQGGDETAGAPPTLDLFEKPNFEGKRVRLDQAISDVAQLEQSVGSLLVRTGSWQICSKPRFRGRCRTVNATGMGVPETPLIGSLRPETD